MDEINAVTPDQIQSLRRDFQEKVQAQSPDFHPNDLERIKTDDLWLRRFLAHAEFKVDTAVTLLYECLQWRKEFGTNELDESKIPRDLLDKGALFIRNRDVFGKKLLIFKAKNHVKGTVEIETIQKFVVYFFERIERETNSDQITIIFDMKDTGWNNMDMDFVRYLITLLKTYYPYFVNYLIIYEMPWLLNAAWKIIKGWLPPKFVDRVKFQDKKNLKDFIDVDNQLVDWGGKDAYVFKFEPATSRKRQPTSNKHSQSPRVMKAHFAGQEQAAEIHNVEYSESASGTPSPISSDIKAFPSQMTNEGDNCLADVEDRILFRSSDNEEYAGRLTVRNVAPNGEPLIIKIKTTSPNKYRVKPIIAVVNRNATATISISTHQGVSATTMIKDRFQVLVAIIPPNMMPSSGSEGSDGSSGSGSNPDLGNNFKQIVGSGAVLETYRVGVSVEARPGDNGTSSSNSIALNDDRLRKGLEELEKKITSSVSAEVTANIWTIKKYMFIGFGVITLLFLWILLKLYSEDSNPDCSKICSGLLESGNWVSAARQGATCGATT